MLSIAIVLFLTHPKLSNVQCTFVQMGADIIGVVDIEHSGFSVSLKDGSTLAVGAPLNGTGGEQSGQVRIYKLINSSWVQQGFGINGKEEFDNSGRSVSLSEDGLTVAIGSRYSQDSGYYRGHVSVYKYLSGNWVQLGVEIKGTINNESAYVVSLSADGAIIAIGSPRNEFGESPGHVKVFKYLNGIWLQQGENIEEVETGFSSGSPVSLSADGLTLAMGYFKSTGQNTSGGKTKVFKFIDNTWVQQGETINGESGVYSLALSNDGKILAIGEAQNPAGSTERGRTKVFTFIDSNWLQLGSNIDGKSHNEQSGFSLSLSGDGSTIAIGAPYNSNTAYRSGCVRIYRFANNEWTQVGVDIDGKATSDMSGRSVSLSSDGTIVAIGSPISNFGGTIRGYTRVFQCSNINNIVQTSFPSISFHPNPFDKTLYLILNSGNPANVSIIDIYGKTLINYLVNNTDKLDLSSLRAGVYFLAIQIGNTLQYHKIIKH